MPDKPVMFHTEVRGLVYTGWQCGQGDALLCLHGFTGCRDNWLDLCGWLPARRIAAVDLPGHGGTQAPEEIGRMTIEETAADLAALCASLAGGPLDVLGYSMGGRLALYFALAYPHLVRRLILESASPGLESEKERQIRCAADEALADKIEQDGLTAFIGYWEALPLFTSQARLPETAQKALRTQRMQNSTAGLAASLRGMGTGRQPSLWPRLGELQAPVLLLTGELDDKFVRTNTRMAALLPGSQLEIIPGAGHTIHLEKPTEFRRRLRTFLKGSEREGE